MKFTALNRWPSSRRFVFGLLIRRKLYLSLRNTKAFCGITFNIVCYQPNQLWKFRGNNFRATIILWDGISNSNAKFFQLYRQIVQEPFHRFFRKVAVSSKKSFSVPPFFTNSVCSWWLRTQELDGWTGAHNSFNPVRNWRTFRAASCRAILMMSCNSRWMQKGYSFLFKFPRKAHVVPLTKKFYLLKTEFIVVNKGTQGARLLPSLPSVWSLAFDCLQLRNR